MRSRLDRRRRNRGLKLLLGIIVTVFLAAILFVGIKFFLTGSLSGLKDKGKAEEKTEELVKVTSLEISCENAVVRAGESLNLTVNATPANATDKSVVWSVPEGMGTVTEAGVFTPSTEAGKSDVEVTAKTADGSEITGTIKVRVLEAIDPTKPMVAITYDDGPNPDTTPMVLDVLEENYAVATFFMQGYRIEGNEDILKRSYALGNELGSHTWDHPELAKCSSETIKKQLDDTDAAIQAVVDVENPILRPPYGSFNDTVKSVCGKPIIMWSVDTLDWDTRSSDLTYQSCMTAKDGDIILMHDIHSPTAVATEDIVKGLQDKGFQLVTVTELYEYRKGEYGPGSVHYSMTVEEYNKILEAEAQAAASTEAGEDTTVSTSEEGTTAGAVTE